MMIITKWWWWPLSPCGGGRWPPSWWSSPCDGGCNKSVVWWNAKARRSPRLDPNTERRHMRRWWDKDKDKDIQYIAVPVSLLDWCWDWVQGGNPPYVAVQLPRSYLADFGHFSFAKSACPIQCRSREPLPTQGQSQTQTLHLNWKMHLNSGKWHQTYSSAHLFDTLVTVMAPVGSLAFFHFGTEQGSQLKNRHAWKEPRWQADVLKSWRLSCIMLFANVLIRRLSQSYYRVRPGGAIYSRRPA